MDGVCVIVLMICHSFHNIRMQVGSGIVYHIIGDMTVFKDSEQAEYGTVYINDLHPPVELGEVNLNLKAQESQAAKSFQLHIKENSSSCFFTSSLLFPSLPSQQTPIALTTLEIPGDAMLQLVPV